MSNVGISTTIAQTVHRGASGGAIATGFVTVQAVESLRVSNVFVAGVIAQVLHSGALGGRFGTSGSAAQVIYTTGAPNTARQRAWFYDLDGHSNYVLDLAENGAFVYDITTQQWSHYETSSFDGHWNMKNGFHWRAGKMIVGGDMANGSVYQLVPGEWLDEGWRPVVYEVRGALFATDLGKHRQFALRLIGSAGRTADDEIPVLNMQFSDDSGATWSQAREITLTSDTQQRIEWRSLGAFIQPGRIFRLYDTGGVKFIASVVADIEE